VSVSKTRKLFELEKFKISVEIAIKMKIIIKTTISCLLLISSFHVFAVPAIQLGVKDTNGDYLPYGSNTTPAEDDTAVTSNSPFSLDVGMSYAKSTVLMGGQYLGTTANNSSPDPLNSPDPDGLNWSDFGYDGTFDSHDALLMVSASGTGTLSVGGTAAFYTTNTFEDGFVMPKPPSNHAPVQESNLTYMFFDIGDFLNNMHTIPDFADPSQGNGTGQIKSLNITASGFDWAHFDAFALVTSDTVSCEAFDLSGKGVNCTKSTAIDFNYSTDTKTGGNPGSHDVTWVKDDNGSGGGGGNQVPEPSSIALIGLGLVAFSFFQRRRTVTSFKA